MTTYTNFAEALEVAKTLEAPAGHAWEARFADLEGETFQVVLVNLAQQRANEVDDAYGAGGPRANDVVRVF